MAIEKLIESRISRAINERVFPACVVGIIKKSGQRLVLPAGNFTYEDNSPVVTADSIFDVASITKAIPTSSLALKLIDEGKLAPGDKLIDFIPEFRNRDRDEVLIRHLLTYTLDWDFYLSSLKNESADKILERILTADFQTKPGRKLDYINSTSILLGLLVEQVLGETLDTLGNKYFFEPLKMDRTTFWPLKKFDKEEIVPTENDDWRGGDIQGEVHDESTFVFMKDGRAIGSAGLFSTVQDLLNFLEMLLNKGELKGKRYFSPEIVNSMHTNQLEYLGESAGLGWELYQPRYMGQYCAKETFGKTGFTGCVVICDISKGVGMAMLSNATYPKRKPRQEHMATINAVRRDIADIIFTDS